MWYFLWYCHFGKFYILFLNFLSVFDFLITLSVLSIFSHLVCIWIYSFCVDLRTQPNVMTQRSIFRVFKFLRSPFANGKWNKTIMKRMRQKQKGRKSFKRPEQKSSSFFFYDSNDFLIFLISLWNLKLRGKWQIKKNLILCKSQDF